MRTLTVALPEEVYEHAQDEASARGLSLSVYLRDVISDAVARSTRSEFARRRALQLEALAAIDRFDASNRLPREDLYPDR